MSTFRWADYDPTRRRQVRRADNKEDSRRAPTVVIVALVYGFIMGVIISSLVWWMGG